MNAWFFSRPAALLLLLAWGAAAGCASGPRDLTPSPAPPSYQQGQIIEATSGRIVSYPDWLHSLDAYDVIYLGEEHYNAYHIEAARRVLTALASSGVRPVLGMEMFGWDGQPALDRYLSDPHASRETFLQEARWQANWGGAFEHYEPLVNEAREQRAPVLAMNPPKTLIRRVVKLGLAQARQGEEWTQWGLQDEQIVDEPAYRARILDQLRRCHGGGSEEDYRRMYEASMVRDEGMAKTVAAAVQEGRQHGGGERHVVVSYTGGGHIQYGLPVPQRVKRRLDGRVRHMTVYMTSFDPAKPEDIAEFLREPIADYLWLTPPSEQGPVQRCR